MLITDILERESWRVIEDNSKEPKSGTEVVGKCVKGSWMRKPMPPLEEELLPECLRGTQSKVQLGRVQLKSLAEVVIDLIQVSVKQKRSGL